MINKHKSKKWFAVLMALDAFFSIGPYLIWESFMYYRIFDIFKMAIEIGAISLFIYIKKRRIRVEYFYFAGSFIALYLFYVLDAYPGTLSIHVGTITKGLLILIFLISDRDTKKEVFCFFSLIFAISIIPGIIFDFLSIIGVSIPGNFIESTQEIKVVAGQHYKHYFGCVFRENIYYSPRFKQLCGMLDEPGALGTTAALLLCGEKFELYKKKHLMIVLVGGMLTMSLAFYLIIFIFIISHQIKDKKISKKKLAIMAFFCALLIMLWNNSIFNEYIVRRLSFVKLVNNNRTSDEFDYIYRSFINDANSNIKLLFGNGNDNPVFHSVDASSYKVIIYNMGVFGFLFIITWFVYWGLKFSKKRSDPIILLVIFIISIYQRPWIMYLYSMVLLFGGIENSLS